MHIYCVYKYLDAFFSVVVKRFLGVCLVCDLLLNTAEFYLRSVSKVAARALALLFPGVGCIACYTRKCVRLHLG